MATPDDPVQESFAESSKVSESVADPADESTNDGVQSIDTAEPAVEHQEQQQQQLRQQEEQGQEQEQEIEQESAPKTEKSKESTPAFLTDSPVPSEPAVVETPEKQTDTSTGTSTSAKRKRLPQDVIGRLEDAVSEDPNDVASWWSLIAECKKQDKLDDLRNVYERMTKLFPTSAEVWIDYSDTELSNGEFLRVEQIFSRCLTKVLNVNLWSHYLAYVRRRNDTKSGDENAINVVSQVFEFVLGKIGLDKDSGAIWSQYLDFIKSKPASSTWEEQQKMDLLRKTYRRAIVIPLVNLESLWQGYNSFETSINKSTARKFIAERSAAYMLARSALREMQNTIDGIDRLNTTPKPRKWTNSERKRARKWLKWIDWEKKNPLESPEEDVVRERTWYACQQAVMAMRYFPEIWYEASQYAFDIGKKEDGLEMLKNGCEANPHSFLLFFKKAEYEEQIGNHEDMESTYKKLIENLTQYRSAKLENSGKVKELESNAKDVTAAYTVYMKSVNRSLGVKAARAVFGNCRKLEYSTFHIFVTAAKIEHYNNKEPSVPSKIFDVGMRRFSENSEFVKEYFDFLILKNDDNNARALFEKSVSKMTPEAAKPLFEHFIKYESNYGELSALIKLEERYKALYSNSRADIELFASRNVVVDYDAIQQVDFGQKYRPASSTSVITLYDSDKESRGKSDGEDSQEDEEDDDEPGDMDDDQRTMSGESEPANKKRAKSNTTNHIPHGIMLLLKKLPPSGSYDTVRFDATRLIDLIRDAQIPDSLQ